MFGKILDMVNLLQKAYGEHPFTLYGDFYFVKAKLPTIEMPKVTHIN